MERLENHAAATILDDADDPEVAVQKQQQNAILAHCLTKLLSSHREVIDLVYYHERSIDEVAAILGVPPSTVKTRMFYARNHIAKLLSNFVRPTFQAPEASACKRRASRARNSAMASVH
jgi:RNA polymerase sigma-70 factor (ECF subfamily)